MDWGASAAGGGGGPRPTTDLRAMMLETPYQPPRPQQPIYYEEQDEDQYEEEQEEVEEEEDEEEQPAPKQNFKDLLQQYDQLLVAQGVLPAFMLESSAVENETTAEQEDDDELVGEDEEEEDEEEQLPSIPTDGAAPDQHSQPVVQATGASEALIAWISSYQSHTFGQQKRNARRMAATEQKGAGPLGQPPYLDVEKKILRSLWNIESGDAPDSAFRLIYAWMSSYSQAHPSDYGDHVDLFYLYFNLLLNEPEVKAEEQRTIRDVDTKKQPHKFVEEVQPPQNYHLDADAQLHELGNLATIFSTNRHIRTYCHRQSWALGCLELLLRLPLGERSSEFIDAIVNIVSLLLQDGVSVLELRKLFRTTLILGDGPLKSIAAPKLLDQVGKLLAHHYGPTAFFEFNAITETGLLLPTISQWPIGGYSFSCWLWIDSFSDPAGKPLEYFPYLFSFSGEHGQGLELSFSSPKALVFKTFWKTKKGGDNARIMLSFDKHPLEAKRWYFLTLVHTHGTFLHGSVVDLYIDAHKICSTALSYPRFEEENTKPFTLCTVGCHIQDGHDTNGRPGRGGEFAAFHSYLLHGRMSAFLFFDVPLQPNDIKSLYINCYRNDFLSLITKTELGQKVFIGYAPRASSGKNAFMEISSSLRPLPSSEVPSRALKKAEAMPGTTVGPFYIPMQQGLAHVLKGVPFLLTLLHKLCTSSSVPSNLAPTRVNSIQQSNLQITIDCFLYIVDLLSRTLRNDLKNAERELLSHEGFAKLAAVLSRVSPSVWNAPQHKALDALYTLTQAIAKMGDLTDEMFKHIYLNFDIWIYTSSPAQHALLDLVTTHVVQQPQHFKRLIGIKGVLDILRSYYWYTDRPGKSYLDRSNPDRDSNTGANHKKKRRLTADEVKCLRQRLLSWIQVFIQTRETASIQTEMLEDVRSIFTYIQYVAVYDPMQLLELLPLLSSLLRKSSGKLNDINIIIQAPKKSGSKSKNKLAPAPPVAKPTESEEISPYGGQIAHCLMQASGKSGLNAFIELLAHSQDESIKVWILRVIGDILNCLNEDKKLHLLSGRALQLDASQIASIKSHLQTTPITPTIYAALMALLLGGEAAYEAISAPPTFSPVRPTFTPRPPSSTLENTPDRYPAEQPGIASLLSNAPPSPYSPQPPISMQSTKTKAREGHLSNPGIIPIIFELVVEGGHSDAELHATLLRDFLYLLSQSSRNRTAFLEASLIGPLGTTGARIGSWQWKAWLFGLLGKNNALFPQILDFFVTLLNHIISAVGIPPVESPSIAVADAKNHLRETQSLCKYFGEKGGFFDWAYFCGHLHKRLLSLIVHTIRTFDPVSMVAAINDLANDFTLLAGHDETVPSSAGSATATTVPPLPPRPPSRSRLNVVPSVPPRTHQERARRELEKERERRERQLNLKKEKQVEQATAIVRARNWLTWLKLVEEYIFYSPSPSAALQPKQSDPFFQALHYNDEGKWEDLRFGQETLKLIDSLTQKIEEWRNAYGATPNPHVEKIQKKLQLFNERFAVRLALTTLHEADCSLINERESVGVGSLESLESIVRNEVASARGLSSDTQNAILTATADYLALKRHDLYTRTQETEQIYQGCIERLGWRFVGAESQYDLNPMQGILARYFVVGFLFRAMKHSHEKSGGRGAKIILPLFKSLLIDLKHRCLGFVPSSSDNVDADQARLQAMIVQSKEVLEQLDDDSILPYFMKGLSSGAEDFLLIGPMGAAIANEHASITRLSDARRQLLKDIEVKVLAEMQAKTSLEAQLRKEFAQLLEDHYSRWQADEKKHEEDYDLRLRKAWESMEHQWSELNVLYLGERAFEKSDTWVPYCPHQISVPPPLNAPSSSTDLPPAILLISRNTYLPRQEGQISVQGSALGNVKQKHWPGITHVWVWERTSLVNILYNDFSASLHAIQDGDGRPRKGATSAAVRPDYTILPDRNAGRGPHFYQHLMMMPALSAPTLSSTAFTTPPIAFLPMPERNLAIIHGANWDNSVVVGNMEDGSASLRFIRHRDVVTCVSLASDGQTLLTGAKDATLVVWGVQSPEIRQQGLFSSIFAGRELPLPRLVYKLTLVGHDDAITCCDLSTELSLCASGSNDGTALVFDMRTGGIIASLNFGGSDNAASPLRAITHIKLIGHRSGGERVGKVLSYCGEQQTFYLHALDGRLLAMRYDSAKSAADNPYITSLTVTRNGRFAISGRSDGLLTLWNLDDLSVRDSMDVGLQRGGEGGGTEEITSLALFEDRLLIVGLKSGILKVFPLAL